MNRLKFSMFGLVAVLSVPFISLGTGRQPFSVSGSITAIPGGSASVSVSFTVPQGHHLYADSISIKPVTDINLGHGNIPPPSREQDPAGDTERDVYTNNFTITYELPASPQKPLELVINFQGCRDQLCFPPVTSNLILSPPGTISQASAGQPQASSPATTSSRDTGKDWKSLMNGFQVSGKKEGYMSSDAFLKFMADSEKGGGTKTDRIRDMFQKHGIWTLIGILMIVLGGLGLNLTPCVLPMIPVNIGIIGAGTGAGSKTRGLLLGGVYGAAIALTYGLLGLVVVFTGSRFGALNSSYIFNAVIAAVFLVLAVAMFDVLTIDFSRFQKPTLQDQEKKGKIFTAFVMGSVAALLAGACVAPVVVTVLLLSGDFYRHGEILGLFLPFLLGAGMGLPWPFMGAGFSLLPKPGRWMERIKHFFGVVIIGVALYYGHLAFTLFMDNRPENKSRVEAAQQESIRQGWLVSLKDALEQAKKENKPVFVDFWASWCKNCLAMEKTTFRNPEVMKQLGKYVKVKYRAEQPDSPETNATMEYFDCFGLPTYVVLVPVEEKNEQQNR